MYESVLNHIRVGINFYVRFYRFSELPYLLLCGLKQNAVLKRASKNFILRFE
jgi:hypothetical protein